MQKSSSRNLLGNSKFGISRGYLPIRRLPFPTLRRKRNKGLVTAEWVGHRGSPKLIVSGRVQITWVSGDRDRTP